MSETKSLADMAVETLAAVKDMDKGLENENAERHTVRALKQTAELLISGVLLQTRELAYAAEDLRKLHRELEK